MRQDFSNVRRRCAVMMLAVAGCGIAAVQARAGLTYNSHSPITNEGQVSPITLAPVTVYDNVTGGTGATFATNQSGSFATPSPSGDDVNVLPGTTNLTSMTLGYAAQNFDPSNTGNLSGTLTVKFWDNINGSAALGTDVFSGLLGQFSVPVTATGVPAADPLTGAPGFAAFRPTFDLTTLVGPNGVLLNDNGIGVQAIFTNSNSGNNADWEVTMTAGRTAPLVGTSVNGNFADFNANNLDESNEFWSFGTPSATVPAANFRMTLSGNVPEPTSLALLGLASLGIVRRRRA